MIKYKVRDVAKDLGVSVKEISDILEKNCGVTKKAMATLEESELNIVFDAVTQKNNVANFDKFFASRNKTAEPAKAEVKAEKKANNKDSKDNKPAERMTASLTIRTTRQRAKSRINFRISLQSRQRLNQRLSQRQSQSLLKLQARKKLQPVSAE